MAPKKDAGGKDECVAYAMDCLWANLDQHMKDKFIFPQIVSHAVARTVAGMVHMVSVGTVQRLENWNAHLDGRVEEEWEIPKEPVLPPIDTWARGVIPVKKPQLRQPSSLVTRPMDSAGASDAASQSPKRKSRRATVTLAPSPTPVAATEIYDRKGSPLRRFSEGYVLPPELIHKFKTPDDAASVEGSQASAASSKRKSIRKASMNARKSLQLNNSRGSTSSDAVPPKDKRASIKRMSMMK